MIWSKLKQLEFTCYNEFVTVIFKRLLRPNQIVFTPRWFSGFYYLINEYTMVFSGFPSRVCNVPQLLPWAALRGGARLHVPASALQDPLQDAQPPVRLHLRLDNAEAEGCCKCSWVLQSSSHQYAATAVVCLLYIIGVFPRL